MKKINYIETEERLYAAGHGVEFHYWHLTDKGERFRPDEPVAILEFDGWWNNKSKPIHVRIHPVSSPKLNDMDGKPEVIIAEVKEAIEIFLRDRPKMDDNQLTENVRTWVNA
jgi:hypothetical protein